MSRCLSAHHLLSLHVGGGTTAQQTHADACDACAVRAAGLRRDVRQIAAVLGEWPAPRVEPTPAPRRWPAVGVAAAAAVAAAALLWVHGDPWPGSIAPPPPPAVVATPGETASLLHDVSMAMFSIDGDPNLASPDALAELGPLGGGDPACEPAEGLDAGCAGSGFDVTL
jgi:hypothetical protein